MVSGIRLLKTFCLVVFLLLLVASSGFSDVKNVDLSSASGSPEAIYNSGRWEIKTNPSLSTVILNETRSQVESGTHQNTTVVEQIPIFKLGPNLGGNGSDGSFDLSLGSTVGGCHGPGMTYEFRSIDHPLEAWYGPTCVINTDVKDTFNFTTVNIPGDTRLWAYGSKPLRIYATGDITIAGIVSVSAYNKTTPGAGGYGPAQGPGAGTSVTQLNPARYYKSEFNTFAGGGGFGGVGVEGYSIWCNYVGCHEYAGVQGNINAPGGIAYDEPTGRGGSGGGNFTLYSGQVIHGGAGGGALFLETGRTLILSGGSIYANGGDPTMILKTDYSVTNGSGCTSGFKCYSSGGGSGGRIDIVATSFQNFGAIRAFGGISYLFGAGAGGRVKVKVYGSFAGYTLSIANAANHGGGYRCCLDESKGSVTSQTLSPDEAPIFCSGTFTSTVHDLLDEATQKTWTYLGSTPSSTSVTVSVRFGPTPSYDPMTWSEWRPAPSSNGILPANGRYFQYKVDMQGAGGSNSCSASPTFGYVTVRRLHYFTGPVIVATDNVQEVVAGLIENVSITQNTPENTNIKWVISVSGGPWRKYVNGAWENISSVSDGNTAQELTSINEAGWRLLGVGSIRFAFAMTGNQNSTPSVSRLSVNYSPVQVSASNLDCPARLHRGVKGTCSITCSSNIGNLVYQWTGAGATFTPTSEGSAELYFDSKGRKSVLVKIYVDGHPTVSVTRTAQIEVIDTPKPSLFVEGPRSVCRGQEVTYRTVVDCPSNFQCNSELVIDGVTMSSPATFTVSKSGVMEVVGKSWIGSLQDSVVESSMKVYINEVRKPFVSISAPRLAELGSPITLKATVTAKFGTPEGHWILPDESTVPGTELVYIPTEKTDSLVIRYKAWIAGYPDTETIAESRKIKVDSYEMPQFKIKNFMRSAEGYAPSNIVLGVSGDLSKVIDFGVKLTHRWDLGDGTVKEGDNPRMVNHIYSHPGVYRVTLTVEDDRGGSSFDTYTITVLEVPQLVVEFRTYASNPSGRIPLNIFARPVIKGGHPQLDKIFNYEWSVNGELVSTSRILSLNINEPGDYTIGLRVVSKSGKIGYGELNVTAHPNQLPVCTISHTDHPKNKVTKLTASCNDPDGRIMSYEWDVGGATSKSTNIYMRSNVGGVFEARLTVTDDSRGTATFTYPFTIER